MDCRDAFDTSTVLLVDSSDASTGIYPYQSSPSYIDYYTFTKASDLFTNPNSVDCGDITSCELKPEDCTDVVYSGNLQLNTDFGI